MAMDGEDTRMNEVNSEHPARGGRGALMLALAALAIAITTAIAVWYVADATDRSL